MIKISLSSLFSAMQVIPTSALDRPRTYMIKIACVWVSLYPWVWVFHLQRSRQMLRLEQVYPRRQKILRHRVHVPQNHSSVQRAREDLGCRDPLHSRDLFSVSLHVRCGHEGVLVPGHGPQVQLARESSRQYKGRVRFVKLGRCQARRGRRHRLDRFQKYYVPLSNFPCCRVIL